MAIRTLDDFSPRARRLGVRVDINSPMVESALADDARLRAHVDTLDELAAAGARVAVLAHQGRPGGDEFTDLRAHADRLGELLDAPVSYVDGTFSADARERIAALDDGEVLVLENTRFYSEEYMEFSAERAAETFLVERLATTFDGFVNDAFAAAHRAQPSLVGFPRRLPSYAGRVMERELSVLGTIGQTARPRIYLLGGAKVDDSLRVAESVLDRELADEVLTVGVVGNVFLLAAGVELGDATESVIADMGYEEAVERAAALLDTHGDCIRIPSDVAVERDGERVEYADEALPADGPAFDVGERTMADYAEALAGAGTAILNGPAGRWENEGFIEGTRRIYAAAQSAGFSIVGGGDTAAALRRLDIGGFDHVSTGGGAAMRMLAGETLPAVEALRDAR